VIFLTDKKACEMSGYQKIATNNQMELEAIQQAFILMTDKNISGYTVNIFSDSKYCIDGLEK
jgi:ribonuclease HI